MSDTSSTIQVTVRYFASIREAMGTDSEQLQTRAGTVGALREEIRSARTGDAAAALAPAKAVRMALNQDMCKADAAIQQGDEIAFFPPVTGG